MSRFTGRVTEDRTHGPAPQAPSDGFEGIYSGTLNSAPSGGQCLVVIPALDQRFHHETFCRSDATGSVGDFVIVAFDENKMLFLVLSLGRSSP